MSAPVTHGTVVVEREFATSSSRLFDLFAKASEREKWGAPNEGAAYIIEKDDFREGGNGLVRCGNAADPRITVQTHYHRISNGRLLVFTEHIRNDGDPLAVNVTTAEFVSHDAGCRLRTTIQIASFIGEEMISNTRMGHEGSMDGLERYLARTAEI
ncbi:SRPBCC domain-containing protein [Qipengyuania qiaonensis]|uniref:SRPBCC domain-containing protein n=1 Tax=Qipengyuania qiaonensis TaxID=2867240 RepID=A0ABS7J9N2_9SPHN|nr:SRPBCC domain-containing protein [Qipengyuania qiaonensis]MBX7484030.1 SRPBCC domain-containing protein [Qipengyuania qiaonensis]